MKRTLQTLLSMVVVAASLASCVKETLKENSIPAGEKIQVAVSGSIGEFVPANGATKANAESVVRVTWAAADDKVYVYDGSAYLGSLDVTPNVDNPSHALLSGTINPSEATPTNLSLVYVKGAETAPVINGGKISVDISTQSATGVADVPFVLYATIEYDAEKLTKENEFVPFSFATSVMTVNCTNLPVDANKAKINITKAKIDGVSTACELTVDGTGVTAVSGTTPGTITRTAGFEQADSRGSFKLALAADPATPAARNILVFQDSKVSGAAFTSTTLAEGNSYNTVYQMGEYISNAPDGMLSGEFTVNASGKKVHFSQGNLYAKKDDGGAWKWHFYDEQYKYNSIATSSGSRMAEANDTEIDLFTWGYDNTSANTSYSLNPINTTGISGHTTDGDKQFSASEDWGYVFGGEPSVWRTLTSAEWQYLFNTRSNASNLYMCGVTVCGSVNCLVIAHDDWDLIAHPLQSSYGTDSSEGNPMTWEQAEAKGLVCLPAAGGRLGSNVHSVGVSGDYWSSTARGSDNAYDVFFGSGGVSPDNVLRYNGCSVRLITESAGGYAPAVKVTGVTMGKEETSITVGSMETLAATIAPANATNKQIIWSSSKPSVATVDENGEVTAKAAGTANIFATTADGNFTAVCLVTVKTLPDGVLPGVFSVGPNATDKVHFSKGNLTYNVSTTTWAFYGHQCDCATGYDASLISLFTWGYDATNSIVPGGEGYVGGHTDENDKQLSKSEDWGYVFGRESSIWRTLTAAEWDYLFATTEFGTNQDTESPRYNLFKTGVKVCGVENCLIIAPDDWDLTASPLQNEYSPMTWEQAEAAGLVCLPPAGYRYCDEVFFSRNCYWSSTADDSEHAYHLNFDSSSVSSVSPNSRFDGGSVRLVTDAR